MISVLIPCFNNRTTIEKTVASVLIQEIGYYEILISDDASTDDSVKVIEDNILPKSKRIKLIKQQTNLGCGDNLNFLVSQAKYDILYFLSGDDMLLDRFVLAKTGSLFDDPKLAVVTRPYYWFTQHIAIPVRIRPIKFKLTPYDYVQSFDQISGIALRKSMILNKFSNAPFIEMASVAFPMACKFGVTMMVQYTVAIRIGNNGSTNPAVYANSPLKSWESVVKNRKLMKCFANDLLGLAQIKRFATFKELLREIRYHITLNKINALKPHFLLFFAFILLCPKGVLGWLVEKYRRIPK